MKTKMIKKLKIKVKNSYKNLQSEKNQKKKKASIIHVRTKNGKFKKVKIKGIKIILNPLNDEEWNELEAQSKAQEED